MPRVRTASAIAKSKLTAEQKAENRKTSRAKANRNYRLRYVAFSYAYTLLTYCWSCHGIQQRSKAQREGTAPDVAVRSSVVVSPQHL